MQSADRPGLWSALGTQTNVQATVSGNVIDTTKAINYASISADTTFTFSEAPAAGTLFGLQIHNSDFNFAKTVTIPSSFSVHRQSAITTFAAQPSLNTVVGDVFVWWYYDGTTYFIFGDVTNGMQMTPGQYSVVFGKDAGLAATSADFSTFVGVEAGRDHPNSGGQGSAVAVGYQAGYNPGGYAGTWVGYKAGHGGGGTSSCGIGYSALGSADGTGTGNNIIGVHGAESAIAISGTQGMGYHVADQVISAINAVLIGDHCCAVSAWTVDNCIFVGPFTGSNRASTLSIEGTGTSLGAVVPLIYGQFDTFHVTLNGGALVTGTAKAAASTVSVASAALEVQSTTQGLLFPRMTTTQKNAISSPAEGLCVYDTTLHKLCVRTASAWETVTSS